MVLTSDVIRGIDILSIVSTMFSLLQPSEVYELLTKSHQRHQNTWFFAYFHEIPQIYIDDKVVKNLYNFLMDDSDKDIQPYSNRDISFLDKYLSVDADVILSASRLILKKQTYSPFIVTIYFLSSILKKSPNSHQVETISLLFKSKNKRTTSFISAKSLRQTLFLTTKN